MWGGLYRSRVVAPHGIVWALMVDGFKIRSALALYTEMGLTVTNLRYKTTPILSIPVNKIGDKLV